MLELCPLVFEPEDTYSLSSSYTHCDARRPRLACTYSTCSNGQRSAHKHKNKPPPRSIDLAQSVILLNYAGIGTISGYFLSTQHLYYFWRGHYYNCLGEPGLGPAARLEHRRDAHLPPDWPSWSGNNNSRHRVTESRLRNKRLLCSSPATFDNPSRGCDTTRSII